MNCDFPVMIELKRLMIFSIIFIVIMEILVLPESNLSICEDWLSSQFGFFLFCVGLVRLVELGEFN